MPAVAQKSAEKGAWFRGLDAMTTEHDAAPTRIEGKLPAELRGTLYRIGPGQNEVFGTRNGHWFDGDGMIAAFRFDGGKVTYRNRFVRTPYYLAEQKKKKMLYPGFATRVPGGPLRNALRQMKNPANTNTQVFAGRLLAMWEGGRPFSLNPDTLETIGEEDFSGAMPKRTFFSAHPHRDPRTGNMINLGPIMGPNPLVQPWTITPEGRATRLPQIPIRKPFMLHDYGLTETKIVLLGQPFYIELQRMLGYVIGTSTIFDAFRWHPDEPMTVYVGDRNGHEPVRHYELPAGIVFHVSNAFEENGDIIIDAILYADDAPLRTIQAAFRGELETNQPGKLTRIRLGKNGKATRETLSDIGMEFPRINERLDTTAYTYCYGTVDGNQAFATSEVVKVDTRAQIAVKHDFGAGCYAGEAIFVPRPGATREDDGWVMSLVYDSRDHHSFVGIIPADRFEDEAARVHLPFHSTIGFHGSFAPT